MYKAERNHIRNHIIGQPPKPNLTALGAVGPAGGEKTTADFQYKDVIQRGHRCHDSIFTKL